MLQQRVKIISNTLFYSDYYFTCILLTLKRRPPSHKILKITLDTIKACFLASSIVSVTLHSQVFMEGWPSGLKKPKLVTILLLSIYLQSHCSEEALEKFTHSGSCGCESWRHRITSDKTPVSCQQKRLCFSLDSTDCLTTYSDRSALQLLSKQSTMSQNWSKAAWRNRVMVSKILIDATEL